MPANKQILVFYGKKGMGKNLLFEAEKIAKKNKCTKGLSINKWKEFYGEVLV